MESIEMKLNKNTVVFLDTGFFKNYKSSDPYYTDLFEYSKNEEIVLCTSFLCILEWESQKLTDLRNYIKTNTERFHHQIKKDPISSHLLEKFPLNHPEDHEIESLSKSVLSSFLDENKVEIFESRPDHAERTWKAYFDGTDPYKEKKNRNDIPDSWIYEAGKDLLQDSRFKSMSNIYCIGSDKTMTSSLENIGFIAIKPIDLIKALKEEENNIPERKGIKSVISETPPQKKLPDENAFKSLNDILSFAISSEFKEIYLRILGYVHWMNKPLKISLVNEISKKGFDTDVIEASAVMLKSVNLIEDTGNHYLPKNKAICEEAAIEIEDEILDLLNKN
jgi:hypothetical protein